MTLSLEEKKYMMTSFTYNGRSYIDVSLCDTDTNADTADSNVTLSFQIGTSDIHYEIFLTSTNVTHIVPLHSLYVYESVNLLETRADSEYISVPSELPCSIADVWSSLSGSPFNPPQPFLFSGGVAFADISWNLPNRSDSENRTIYTYVLIQDDYVGTSADVMSTFTFSIGPGIVDQRGRRIAGNEDIRPTVKQNITCDPVVTENLIAQIQSTLSSIVSLEGSALEGYSFLVWLDVLKSNLTWIACDRQIHFMYQSDFEGTERFCREENCTSLYERDYLGNLNQIKSGSCDSSGKILDPNIDASWFKGCKESVLSLVNGKTGRPCQSDQDCLFPWEGNDNLTYVALNSTCPMSLTSQDPPHCDYFRGICSDTQENSEDIFWWCVANNMSINVQLTFRFFGIDPCDFSALRESFFTEDCVSQSGTGLDAVNYRSHFVFIAPVTPTIINLNGIEVNPARDHCACYLDIGNEYDFCLDQWCVLPPSCEYTSADRAPDYLLLPSESSVKNDVCSFMMSYSESNSTGCLDDIRCNWNDMIRDDLYQVMGCEGGGQEMFCGVRFDPDDIFYHEIVSVSEYECDFNESKACVTPFGSIILGLTSQDECSNAGYCSSFCPNPNGEDVCLPVDPSVPSICYSEDDQMNVTLCLQMSGHWVSVTELLGNYICIFPLQNNPSECARNGNTFASCTDLSDAECDEFGYLSCFLSDTLSLCETKDECESSGRGMCSDEIYFLNDLVTPPSPRGCVVPFLVDGDRQYCYVGTQPMSLG